MYLAKVSSGHICGSQHVCFLHEMLSAVHFLLVTFEDVQLCWATGNTHYTKKSNPLLDTLVLLVHIIILCLEAWFLYDVYSSCLLIRKINCWFNQNFWRYTWMIESHIWWTTPSRAGDFVCCAVWHLSIHWMTISVAESRTKCKCAVISKKSMELCVSLLFICLSDDVHIHWNQKMPYTSTLNTLCSMTFLDFNACVHHLRDEIASKIKHHLDPNFWVHKHTCVMIFTTWRQNTPPGVFNFICCSWFKQIYVCFWSVAIWCYMLKVRIVCHKASILEPTKTGGLSAGGGNGDTHVHWYRFNGQSKFFCSWKPIFCSWFISWTIRFGWNQKTCVTPQPKMTKEWDLKIM